MQIGLNVFYFLLLFDGVDEMLETDDCCSFFWPMVGIEGGVHA